MLKQNEAKLDEAQLYINKIVQERNQLELRLSEKINHFVSTQKEFDEQKAEFASRLHEKELELQWSAEEIKKLRQQQSISATEMKEMVALAN